MKSMRLLIGLLFLIAGWQGQAQAETNSLLWKVEGEGIKTSYLYGTIHLLPQDAFQMKEKVTKAFNASEQIILEIDIDDPSMQMKIMQNAAMKDGVTLDQIFSEEDYIVVSDAVKGTMGVGLEALNNMKPFMIYSFLIGTLIDGTPASYELAFMKMAKEKDLEVLGLETVEEQMAVFDRVPYEEQAKDVVKMVREREETRMEFDALVKAYNNEDIDGLQEVMASYADTETEMEELINKRNRNWIPVIAELTRDKGSFIGVGAGHLGGDQGVINLLKEAGYTVTPIN